MDNLHLARSGYGYDRGFHTRIQIRGQWYDPYVRDARYRMQDPGYRIVGGRQHPGASRIGHPASSIQHPVSSIQHPVSHIPYPISRSVTWEFEGVPLPCPPEKLGQVERVAQYVRNASLRRSEADYFAPQVFTQAVRWLEQHHAGGPFFMHLDVFDPHEPWDPPQHYVDRYDPDYDGPAIINPITGDSNRYSAAELRHIRALYAGEVTMVDRWLGWLLNAVDSLGTPR